MERTRADVRGTEYLDGLGISPRRGVDPQAVLSALRAALPGVRLHRTPSGVNIPSEHAHQLLTTHSTLDLVWSAEAKQFAENRRRARLVHAQLRAAVSAIKAEGAEAARETIRDAEDREFLTTTKQSMFAAMVAAKPLGLCLFDEQGTGKTISAIFTFDLLVQPGPSGCDAYHRTEKHGGRVAAGLREVQEWSV